MPYLPPSVVDGETFAVGTVAALIVFQQNAAVEDAVDAGACDDGCGVADIKRLPVTHPEVEAVIFGTGAGGGSPRVD